MVTGDNCQRCLEPFGLSQARFCAFCGCPRKFKTSPEQTMKDYEHQRNLNIQRNNAMMESLGLKTRTSPKHKGNRKQEKQHVAVNMPPSLRSRKQVIEISEQSTGFILILDLYECICAIIFFQVNNLYLFSTNFSTFL